MSLRRTLPLCLPVFGTLTVLLFLLSPAFAQDDNSKAKPHNDDVEEVDSDNSSTEPPATVQLSDTNKNRAKHKTQDQLDLEQESENADVPPQFRGLIDNETYLKMRAEHIRLMRGMDDKLFNPKTRGEAIRQMKEQERTLRDQVRKSLSGASVPDSAPGSDTGSGSGTGGANSAAIIASPLVSWTPLGPDPLPNGQTTGVSMPVSGRVTSIAVHPTNENIVYVGTAQGGVYRSLDGGNTWTPLMDDAISLAVGSIAIDPLDPTTLFVGTGEGNLSIDSFFGVGLYIIKHADTNPTLLGPFNKDGNGADIFTGRAITRVLVSPTDDNIVFISTTSGIGGIGTDQIPSVITANLPSRGLYRTTNALSANPTFSKITVQPANAGNRGITDIVFDPANPNVLLAGVNGFTTGGNDGGIWRTTNALAATPTFTNQQVVGTATATIQIRLAANTVNGVTTVLAATGENPATTPAAPGNGSNCGAPGWVRRSTDSGITWSLGLLQTSGFCNTQCFYDMAPAMDPTNSNIIYLGGSANADTNPPRNSCRSNVLTRSLDGTNFTRIDTGLHADTHVVTVAPSNPNVVYFGSDGGVWKSSNGGGTWLSLNNTGFHATQFQSIALHPTDRNFSIGGTQDNGTPFLMSNGTWTRADFGDGGFALIDQNATDTTNVTMYHTYFNQTNNLIGYARVTTTANAHDNGWAFFGCNGTVANNGFRCADAVLFYAPMTLGPGTPNTLYFGTDRLYRSSNFGTSMTLVSQGPFVTGVSVSAIGISQQDDNIRMVGLRNGQVFATTAGANPLTSIVNANFPGKYVSRVVVDPNNKDTAYITYSGFGIQGKQIWKSTNLSGGGSTFTAIAAGIPDVPVNSFAVDPLNSQVLYAGTDIGVYISSDGGANWNPYGTGLPRVAVFDMAIQNPNRLLRIATHGRGAWEIAAAKSAPVVNLSSSLGTSTYGQNLTFSAMVGQGSANVAPSGGTVTFNDGTNFLGTVTIDNTGIANFTTSLLTAGTHSITASYAGDSFFAAGSSTPFTQVVNPASLTVHADNASRKYGQSNPTFTGVITGIQNADNITATYASAASPASLIGTYPIVPTLVDPDSRLGNYSITVINGVLSVTPASLTVTGTNKTRLFGQNNPVLDGTITGIQNSDAITATYSTTATAASPVGTYPIAPTLSDPTNKLGNYDVTINNGTLTVTEALLTITADNKTKLLNAPNPTFMASFSGFVSGDDPSSLSGQLSCTTTATTNSPIGTYSITCTGLSSSNYAIQYIPGTLSVLFASTGSCLGEPGHTILPPIAANGSSVFNAGRTAPAKFRVCDANGVSIGTPGTVRTFNIVEVITGTISDVNLSVDSTTPDTAFRWDPTAQQWIFNISTKSLAPGATYIFRIGLNDGSDITFQFGLR
jgi:hypothetical protein